MTTESSKLCLTSAISYHRADESIERARSFVSDTFNQTRDVTCGSLAASIVSTPSVTAVSLPDDATRISEIGADILNNSIQVTNDHVKIHR